MGETQAFDILFQRHSPRVLGFLTRKTGSDKLAQDLLQEVFLKFHRSRHQYRAGLPLLPWLYSIMRSVMLDEFKKDHGEDIVDPAQLEQMPAAFPVDSGVPAGLELLPAPQRQAVTMRVLDDATFEEIAERLSTSQENARQLVSRALRKLKMIYAPKRRDDD